MAGLSLWEIKAVAGYLVGRAERGEEARWEWEEQRVTVLRLRGGAGRRLLFFDDV